MYRFDGRATVAAFADQSDVVVGGEKQPKATSRRRFVVNHEHPQLPFAAAHRHTPSLRLGAVRPPAGNTTVAITPVAPACASVKCALLP
jgi:hypothetical protein